LGATWLIGLHGFAHAAVVRVPSQAPTIQAGIQAVSSADTVLVAPGIYNGPGNQSIDFDGKNIVLRSEKGPELTVVDGSWPTWEPAFVFHRDEGPEATVEGFTISDCGSSGDGGAIYFESTSSPTFRRCVIADNYVEHAGGAFVAYGGAPRFEDCTFLRNDAGIGGVGMCMGTTLEFVRCIFDTNFGANSGSVLEGYGVEVLFEDCTFVGNVGFEGVVYLSVQSVMEMHGCTFYENRGDAVLDFNSATFDIERTIIAFNEQAVAVACEPWSIVTLACCDIYGNDGGDWVGCIADQYGINGNISEDPLFCNAPGGDLTLDASSPCAPEHSGGCGLIGAWPVGCGTVAVAEHPVPSSRLRLTVSPNPVLQGATFTFDPTARPVSLEIYDPAGRLVERLRPSGGVTWTPGDRAARGIYFARLTAEGASETVKFVVLQ
jgi:hypothetical protein